MKVVTHVTSADGTRIAFDRLGQGPAVVVVSGMFCDRQTTQGLAEQLAHQFTVINYDRRGRGDSSDTQPYAVDREIEDLDALIAEAGGSASVYGHSSGAGLALNAAASGLPITRLVLHEPPYGSDDEESKREARELAENVRTAIAEDRRADAINLFLTASGMLPEMAEGASNDPKDARARPNDALRLRGHGRHQPGQRDPGRARSGHRHPDARHRRRGEPGLLSGHRDPDRGSPSEREPHSAGGSGSRRARGCRRTCGRRVPRHCVAGGGIAVGNAVDEYLAWLPEEQREALEQLRRLIKSVVPGVEEVIRSRVPAFRYNDRPLVSIGAAKRHVSLFIMYGDVMETHKDELQGFDTSNTVIRFTPNKPIPRRLVRKLVKARMAEIQAVDRNEPRLRSSTG
jgi:uncharacterized protein YdhG (YjbR/CyaY superfamily)